MAVPSMTGELSTSAKRIIADVIEEKTGKRPDMSSLKPEVTLEGVTPKITLNGLSPSDIGGLDPEEVITETTMRMGGYAGRVLSLVAYADQTQDLLSFEADVLDAWMSGLKVDAGQVSGAGDDLGDLKVETGAKPAAAPKIDGEKEARKHSAGGLRLAAGCDVGKKPEAPVADAKASKPEKVAQKGAPKGKAASASSASNKTASTKPAASGSSSSMSQAPNASGPVAPAAHVSDPGDKKAGQGCDLVVTNGQGSTCL
jgi:hypothetical protein